MEIATRTHNDVTLVTVVGSLDSNSSPKAQQTLDGILSDGARKLVVDLTALDYISSAGLRVLLVVAKRVQQASGKVVLFGLVPNVREIFAVSGFDRIFTVAEDAAAALAAAQ